MLQFLVGLTLALCVLSTTVDARAHRHRKRALQEDYEYRDTSDYDSNSGVFVDSVPMRTTPLPKHGKLHQRTNRFPKLRKFFEDRYFQ
ncbi:unnamed protein product [Bursaphelenchus xylophilus]|uniref:(pine wood nematode) hypothetical protein n=1 Tax=Bursaphelenchus xylophilus TaxID=6326 RepID=A0A7I8XMF5_BURXY|nr:unnamed protein product [Bursaphelenchus xylophilus]CAG9089480.1 unnamed protein product [Bursaphelenchus xylophilus]